MKNMSFTDLLRNLQNIQQVQNRQNSKSFSQNRILTEPQSPEKPQKIAVCIKQMQSKIEGFQNLMRKKTTNQDSPSNLNKTQGCRPRQMSNSAIETGKAKKEQKEFAKYLQPKEMSHSINKSQENNNLKKSNGVMEFKNINQQLSIKEIETKSSLKLNNFLDNQKYFPLKQIFTSSSPPSSPIRKIKRVHKNSLNDLNESFTDKASNMFLKLINCSENKKTNNSNKEIAGSNKETNDVIPLDIVQTKTQQNKINKNNLNKTISFEQSNNFIQNQESFILNKKSNVIQGFQFGQVLGKGKFGEVYLAKHMETGFIVAIKKVAKSKLLEYRMVDQFIKQIKLHNSFDHPKIVKFYCLLEEKDDIYLVLQYMSGGTLFEHLNKVGHLGVKEAVDFLRDVIEGLMYLHERSIAHRDIKPENIVINSGMAKLCDFGWSAFVESARTTFCGTLDYAPPEIIERKTYDWSVDIWSIGILTYELFIGRAPFQNKDRSKVMQKIVNIDITGIPMIQKIPEEARQFIEALLQKDPSERPKIDELLDFPLFTNNGVKRKKQK